MTQSQNSPMGTKKFTIGLNNPEKFCAKFNRVGIFH